MTCALLNRVTLTKRWAAGKVHAPFLYDPIKKRLFAKAAFLGFNMLKEYCSLKSLHFKQDGVLEVPTYDKAIERLNKYLEWLTRK